MAKMISASREPIEFKTDGGKVARLVYEKVEYRAYMQDGGGWRDLKLGAALPDRLIDYVKRRY